MSKKEIEHAGECPPRLLADVRLLITQARVGVASAVTSGIAAMYWAGDFR